LVWNFSRHRQPSLSQRFCQFVSSSIADYFVRLNASQFSRLDDWRYSLCGAKLQQLV
jgi:hypothetical protein